MRFTLKTFHTRTGASPGQKCGVDTHGERGAPAYNVGFSSAQARAPVSEAPEAKKPFCFWTPNRSAKFASFFVFCKLATQAPNVNDALAPSPSTKTHQICINLRNRLLQKWGAHGDVPVPVCSTRVFICRLRFAGLSSSFRSTQNVRPFLNRFVQF